MNIQDVLNRLDEQYQLYQIADEPRRSMMRQRALKVAYTMAHTEARVAAENLVRDTMLPDCRTALERRLPYPPEEWDRDQKSHGWKWSRYPVKARMARALCGFSLGSDAVCVDLHMERLPKHRQPRDARDQWAKWFAVYRQRYGEERYQWVLDWHYRLLRWVAGEEVSPGLE
jgi:hypothetical protein